MREWRTFPAPPGNIVVEKVSLQAAALYLRSLWQGNQIFELCLGFLAGSSGGWGNTCSTPSSGHSSHSRQQILWPTGSSPPTFNHFSSPINCASVSPRSESWRKGNLDDITQCAPTATLFSSLPSSWWTVGWGPGQAFESPSCMGLRFLSVTWQNSLLLVYGFLLILAIYIPYWSMTDYSYIGKFRTFLR